MLLARSRPACGLHDTGPCHLLPLACCTGERLNASITPSMIGRSVGKKPSEPKKGKPCFGDQAPAFDSSNARRLGDSLLKPVNDSPSFCGVEDRFDTDACATEQRQRQLQQQRYQVQHLPAGRLLPSGRQLSWCSQALLQAKLSEKGRFEAARAMSRQLHNENADNQELTRMQERVYGNKNSVGFNILAPPGLAPEPLQVKIWLFANFFMPVTGSDIRCAIDRLLLQTRGQLYKEVREGITLSAGRRGNELQSLNSAHHHKPSSLSAMVLAVPCTSCIQPVPVPVSPSSGCWDLYPSGD